MAYIDTGLPYELYVDASREGLRGVLYLEQKGGLRLVAYASRSLTPSEKNYPVHKLEFLALKWTVVDKLRDYLYGAEFIVKTDNNSLTYVLTTANLYATGHRWLAAMAGFRFRLNYRPGVGNQDADALSRRPHRREIGGMGLCDRRRSVGLVSGTRREDERRSGCQTHGSPPIWHTKALLWTDTSKRRRPTPTVQERFEERPRVGPTGSVGVTGLE